MNKITNPPKRNILVILCHSNIVEIIPSIETPAIL